VLTLVTPPAVEPVSLEEAKLHLRAPVDLDDPLVTGLIVAARRKCETWLRRTLITSTWDLTFEGFPGCGWIPGFSYAGVQSLERQPVGTLYGIQLPNPPMSSVTSINYIDTAGVSRTLATSEYQVEAGTPGRVVPAYGKTWPATRRQPGAVTIRFVAGYGLAADVPDTIKIAMKLYITSLYENRGEADVALPYAAEVLLSAEDWGFYE
jgi:hypothetical protein